MKVIVVTGAAGFIGANLIQALNQYQEIHILAVDDLTNAQQFGNLAHLRIADYMDKEEFLQRLPNSDFPYALSAVLHQGACSDTMEHQGKYMMNNNYRYTRSVFEYCQEYEIPLIYASSASVYGSNQTFIEDPQWERPLNVYGYSKLAFDQHHRFWQSEQGLTAPCIGLRYFNVYGPMEGHKGRMASVAYHFFQQFQKEGHIRLFEGSGGYGPGEQRRDFIHVDDIVAVNLWLLQNAQISGIFNLGTGKSRSFNDVAIAMLNVLLERSTDPLSITELIEAGYVRYIPFPESLMGKYQNFTQASMDLFSKTGYSQKFLDVPAGIQRYAEWLTRQAKKGALL
jgi:ADP-L-glycero-D-manno-heptose 6-epimerase